LDLATLKKCSGSYVSDELRDRADDLIRRVRWGRDCSTSTCCSNSNPAMADLHGARNMLSNRVEGWIDQWKREGQKQGRQATRHLLNPPSPSPLRSGDCRVG